MSSLTSLSEKEFLELSSTDDGIYLLDFWAPWCGPCVAMNPNLVWMSEQPTATKFKIIKINIDENQQIAQEFGVRSIPHFSLVKLNAGKPVSLIFETVGSQPNKTAFLEKINTMIDQFEKTIV
jgi:thioredoxin-like negative regulator of GroEL